MRHLILALAILYPCESAPICCWSKWGAASACGGYTGGGHGGLCNNDWTHACSTSPDCTAAPTPAPPAPTPTPPAPTPPGPTPPPSPPSPTPPAPPPPAGTVDIIGYYGNSGNAVAMIPKFSDVHENYNVIILTFASISSTGEFGLDIQGPYEKDFDAMAKDLKAWKAVPDKWGRKRIALVSIGGQNGHWPAGVSSAALEAGLDKFMQRFGLDGLDIDLEGGSVGAAGTLISVVQSLTSKGKIVTAAPEASQGPLDGYKDLLKHLTWVHPQFYNNPPNAVAKPWIPTNATEWPTPWTIGDWQAEDSAKQGHAFWAAVLKQIGLVAGLKQSQLGMLFPASTSAAGGENNWDMDKLAQQGAKAGVTHFGNWALAYDRQKGWKAAIALGKLNGPARVLV